MCTWQQWTARAYSCCQVTWREGGREGGRGNMALLGWLRWAAKVGDGCHAALVAAAGAQALCVGILLHFIQMTLNFASSLISI
jgi:hypothetical protein